MRALDGTRILLTRSQRGCAQWAARVREQGGVPVSFPCISRVPVAASDDTATRLRDSVDRADWLALTSPFGAEVAARLLENDLPELVAVAVVGPATAAVAQRRFGRVDLLAAGGTGAALATQLLGRLNLAAESAPRVVVAAAEGGLEDLEQELEPRGVTVERFAIYRTEPGPPLERRERFASAIDVVLVASPSAVDGLQARAEIDPHIPIVTIGPTTSAAVEAAGMRVAAQAEHRSLEAMLEAIP